METEKQPASMDLKVASFKALLQGPVVFSQFGARFGVSVADMQGWIDDALANLALACAAPAPQGRPVEKRCSFTLAYDERRILLEGKPPV